MSKRRILVSSVILSLVGIASSARAATDAELVKNAEATLANARHTDPGLGEFVSRSAGYVVFPSVGKGGAVIGGAHGGGVLFAHGGKPVGKVTINQVTVGAQLGGQSYSEIIFLQTPKQVAEIQSGKFSLAAQASAVAIKPGASTNAKFDNGVAIFTFVKGGLMAEATVGGQKLGYEPLKQ
jgi:lipid-binding SYLF domain-containing protein